MPKYSYEADNFPSQQEFIRQLRENSEQEDPIEELLALERGLTTLEQQHGVSSAQFYEDYQNGKAGDSVATVAWAAKYRLYLSLKEAISDSLKRVVAETS